MAETRAFLSDCGIDTSGEQVYDGVSAFILEAGEDLTVPASSEDPGSDDLRFRWDWDGTALNGETPDEQTSLNDPGAGPDPALSPSIHPRNVPYAAFDEVHWVGPAESVWMCRRLAKS